MSVKLEDRPIEQVREECIDKLIINYSHGVISSDAFERRLDELMTSEVHSDMLALVADLEMNTDKKYDATKEQQFTPNYAETTDDEVLTINSILSSAERSGQWSVPKRIKVLNVIGSVTLDFTDAIFHHQNITVEIFSILASDEIYVPENVNVVCQTYGVVSSIENKSPSLAHRQAPTITIVGKSIIGSLEIKVKRTIKEKFLAFAEQMKETFGSNRAS